MGLSPVICGPAHQVGHMLDLMFCSDHAYDDLKVGEIWTTPLSRPDHFLVSDWLTETLNIYRGGGGGRNREDTPQYTHRSTTEALSIWMHFWILWEIFQFLLGVFDTIDHGMLSDLVALFLLTPLGRIPSGGTGRSSLSPMPFNLYMKQLGGCQGIWSQLSSVFWQQHTALPHTTTRWQWTPWTGVRQW